MNSFISFLLLALFSPVVFFTCIIIRWVIKLLVVRFEESKLSKNRKLFQLVFFCHFFTCILSFFLIRESWFLLFLFPFFAVGIYFILKWDIYLDITPGGWQEVWKRYEDEE